MLAEVKVKRVKCDHKLIDESWGPSNYGNGTLCIDVRGKNLHDQIIFTVLALFISVWKPVNRYKNLSHQKNTYVPNFFKKDVFSAIANIFRHQTVISSVIEVLELSIIHVEGWEDLTRRTEASKRILPSSIRNTWKLQMSRSCSSYWGAVFCFFKCYYRNTTSRNLQLLFHTVIGESPTFVFSHWAMLTELPHAASALSQQWCTEGLYLFFSPFVFLSPWL